MSDARIGFGLLGAGLIAPFHARAIQASADCRLVAAADMDATRLGKLTEQFGCRGYASLEAMLADPEVQVVNVLTPNHLHHDAVVAAAKAGRHVLVEKPPAMSLAEVRGMIAAGRQAGVKIGVVLQCRTRKAVQAMRRALAEGRFGKLFHADAYMKWFRSTEYYRMDAWRMSRRSGAGVTIQHTRMNNLAHPGIELEDTLLSFVDFQGGAQGVVQASTALWPGTDLRIELNGENGTAVMVGERIETWKFRDERPEDAEIRKIGSAAVQTGATGAADLGFADHQAVIEDMVCAIRTNSEPVITLASVLPTLEWALAMYQSAKEGRPVALPIVDEAAVW
jgi:predicted dehydrogenase